MHKYYNIYYFIDKFNIKELLNINIRINLIYRNYKSSNDLNEILKIKKFCKKNGFKFYLANNIKIAKMLDLDGVYLPSFNRYEYNQLTGYKSVKKIINDLNIPFIDLDDELFSKEKNPLIYFPFETSSHYNVEGYEKVSEIIYNKTQ